jgi:hypothetical protein
MINTSIWKFAGAIWLTAAAVAPIGLASTYNATTGFSNSSNPNGVWSYYYYDTVSSSDVLYSPATQSGTIFGLPTWINGGGIPDSLTIIQNNSGSAAGGGTITIPNGYLNLDPEGYNVEVVFTVPSTGTYNITGNFYGDDSDEQSHPVEVLDNGSSVYSNTISSYEESDSFSLLSKSLNAGDKIAFFTEVGSTYADLSTGLEATITSTGGTAATPEPSSLFTCAGAAALILFLERKRRRQRA